MPATWTCERCGTVNEAESSVCDCQRGRPPRRGKRRTAIALFFVVVLALVVVGLIWLVSNLPQLTF